MGREASGAARPRAERRRSTRWQGARFFQTARPMCSSTKFSSHLKQDCVACATRRMRGHMARVLRALAPRAQGRGPRRPGLTAQGSGPGAQSSRARAQGLVLMAQGSEPK
eukprot:89675-Pyramimonas_sp.AAC.1